MCLFEAGRAQEESDVKECRSMFLSPFHNHSLSVGCSLFIYTENYYRVFKEAINSIMNEVVLFYEV